MRKKNFENFDTANQHKPMPRETTLKRLAKSFSQADLEHLKVREVFSEALKADNGTVISYETILEIGTILLRKKADLDGSNGG